MKKRRRPGRPPKYNGPTKRLNIVLPYDVVKEMEKVKGDMSWAEFFMMLYLNYKLHSEGSI